MTTAKFYSGLSPEDKEAAKALVAEGFGTLSQVLAGVMTDAEKAAS